MPAEYHGRAERQSRLSLGRVLRSALAQVESSALSSAQWKILRVLSVCRTPALGGHQYLCASCGHEHFVAHACRNRHCPSCQGAAALEWLKAQESCLLPIPYFHLVFTLPHALNGTIRQNRRELFNLLFEAASQTILTFGQNRFGVQLGVTAILHTWSQTLWDHYHLHCLVSGGGLSKDGAAWVGASSHYLFPVRALSQVFRGKFCAGLRQRFNQGKLEFHGQMEGLGTPTGFESLMCEANAQDWVVYAKRPFAGPEQVLAYLSRYTHRVAISDWRLLNLDEQAQTISFRYKDYAQQAQQKVLTLGWKEFVRRFALHILPERFVKIRHYGLLGNRRRQQRIEKARQLLGKAEVSTHSPKETKIKTKVEQEPGSLPCPRCGARRLIWKGAVEPVRGVPLQDSS